MAGPPYFGPDGRPSAEIDWTATQRPMCAKNFLLDTGATRSCVDVDTAIGLTLMGAVSMQQPAGVVQVLLMGGGTIGLEVTDSSTGSSVNVQYTGEVLLTKVNLVGQEVFQALRLNLTLDYGKNPRSVIISR